MPIDIRATVSCPLGTLISGSISDSYVANAGLIKTSGNLVISGLITPAIGTAVTVSYVKAGVSRTIPRRLRVLSSFADILRRTTAVELGCRLTYLQDLRESIDWTAFDDAATTMTEADAALVTVPIRAQAVAEKCLAELGLTASGLALTNKFSLEKYDFGPGYVSVLNDLLLSESVCGYLDSSEVLQVVNLAASGGTGPVMDASQLIDVNKIGAGQLPGEAVTVSYSTLRLKQPETTNKPSPWEQTTAQNRYTVNIPFTNAAGDADNFQHVVVETTTTQTSYKTIKNSDGQDLRLPSSRFTTLTTSTAAVISNIYAEYLANSIGVSPYQVDKYTSESFSYDSQGNEINYQKRVYGSVVFLLASLSVPWVLPDGSVVGIGGGTYGIEGEDRETTTVGNKKQITINTYGPWSKTIPGQLAGSNARDSIETAGEAAAYINRMLVGGLCLIDSRTETVSTNEPISIPTQADINNSKAAKAGNPNNGYRTDSKSSVILAMGSATAQRRVEFSLPKAPDDIFYAAGGGAYGSTASDAPQKAQLFGLTQNRILLGNRNGISIQAAPEVLPSAPFAPFIVRSANASALYRTNGLTWTFDEAGVVVSCDALFWGAVGGTGAPWFPMAPGVSLPAEPATTTITINDSGGNPVSSYQQMTVATAIPAYHETILLSGSLKLGHSIESYDYLPNEVFTLVGSLKLKGSVRPGTMVAVPALTIAAAAQAPSISTGAAVQVPAAGVAIAAAAPSVVGGASVAVPPAVISFTPLQPEYAGRPKLNILPPVAAISIAAQAPTVAAGKTIFVPAAGITVAALAPGFPDPILGFNPLIYFEPNTPGTLTLSGSNITGITDQGSRGWNLSSSTTAPVLYTDGSGNNWIDFGSTQHSNYLRNTSTTTTLIAEIYIVVDGDFGSTFPNYNGLITSTSGWFFIGGNSGSTGFFPNQFDICNINGSTTNNYSSGALTTINSPTLLRFAVGSGSYTAETRDGIQLGMDRDNANRGWLGRISTVVCFGTALSSGDRASLQSIIATRRGITLV